LSPSGERIAKRLIRAHRIIEVFLSKSLNLAWHEVHDVSCKLEHYLSDDIVNKMFETCGKPDTCPHGSPIDLESVRDHFRLKDVDPGDTVVVHRVTDERNEFLTYLNSIGLLIGAKVKIESVSPIDSLINLEIKGKKVAVGLEVSRHVWVVLA
jgi:DtxR family Mn-dependent transcriptional regulator